MSGQPYIERRNRGFGILSEKRKNGLPLLLFTRMSYNSSVVYVML